MTQLPEKFSAGIRLAVEDMKKCAKSSRYKIEMSEWVSIEYSETNKGVKKVCCVCMGGAVMRQTLKSKLYTPYMLGDADNKIFAFDRLRKGNYYGAFQSYTGKSTEGFSAKLPKYYRYDEYPAGFYKWCLAVADEFEKIGE